MEIDLPALRGWIGRREEASETLTAALVQRFEATFDAGADPSDAGGSDDRGPGGDAFRVDGAEAPPMIHLCLTQPAVPARALGPDGHPARGGFLPPVPLPRRMWAGGDITFHAPLRIGDLVTRRSCILDVRLRSGRSGPLCFVTVEHIILGAGRPAVTERQDIVYRGADRASAPTGAAPAPAAAHRRVIRADPTLLFRYSALTFNGHRIHYDAPFVTGTEGYPGLIVHGPLQATLLVRMAQDLAGRPVAGFAFRSLTPLFDDAAVTLNATAGGGRDREGPAMTLWTAREDGPVAMQAQARW